MDEHRVTEAQREIALEMQFLKHKEITLVQEIKLYTYCLRLAEENVKETRSNFSKLQAAYVAMEFNWHNWATI